MWRIYEQKAYIVTRSRKLDTILWVTKNAFQDDSHLHASRWSLLVAFPVRKYPFPLWFAPHHIYTVFCSIFIAKNHDFPDSPFFPSTFRHFTPLSTQLHLQESTNHHEYILLTYRQLSKIQNTHYHSLWTSLQPRPKSNIITKIS